MIAAEFLSPVARELALPPETRANLLARRSIEIVAASSKGGRPVNVALQQAARDYIATEPHPRGYMLALAEARGVKPRSLQSTIAALRASQTTTP